MPLFARAERPRTVELQPRLRLPRTERIYGWSPPRRSAVYEQPTLRTGRRPNRGRNRAHPRCVFARGPLLVSEGRSRLPVIEMDAPLPRSRLPTRTWELRCSWQRSCSCRERSKEGWAGASRSQPSRLRSSSRAGCPTKRSRRSGSTHGRLSTGALSDARPTPHIAQIAESPRARTGIRPSRTSALSR